MRIAYISLHWPRIKSSGIGRKITEQIMYWRQAGHEVEFFSHRTDINTEEILLEGRNIVFKTVPGLVGFFVTEFGRCLAVLKLLNSVKEYNPDLIYLRWGMYVFPLSRMFAISPVVIEINTNDYQQHKTLGIVLSTYNRLTRYLLFKRATGLVFVSNELAKNKYFSRFHRPGVVISNGIDLKENLPVPAPGNPRPRLGFIGTPHMEWHGVDKLIKLASQCPDLDIDIIGLDKLEVDEVQPPNLFFHGYLDKEKSREVLSRVDVGLGTLALHRINMHETSALKSREYLAYGIPIILPYKETDLDDLNLDTILILPNTEENIVENWEKIRDFAFRMRGRRVDRAVIAPRIDSGQKEAARLRFFESCITGK
jgi:hypothetical protein